MFKRMVWGLLVLAVLISASGCGQAAGGFTDSDFYLNIGGTQYRCGEKIEPALEALGDGYAYSEGLSCAYDSVDKTFEYDIATFYTNPLAEGDIISMIYSEDPAVTTSAGIARGSTKQEVLAAHGDGCDDMGNMLVYRVPGEGGAPGRGSLCFDMADDEVIAVFVTTEPV